jgi:hypothetical protein
MPSGLDTPIPVVKSGDNPKKPSRRFRLDISARTGKSDAEP